MIYSNESDVRKIVRQLFGKDRIFWHESSAGGTTGFPDCEIAHEGFLWPVELKAGDVRIEDGMWMPTLRPGQMQVARRLRDCGVMAIVVVGALGDDRLWFGRLSLAEQAQREGNGTFLELVVNDQRFWTMAALWRAEARAGLLIRS